MDSEFADFAVRQALKAGASYAEARLEETSTNGFLLKNGSLQVSGFEKITGLGVRFLHSNSVGFVSLNTLTNDSVKNAITASIGRIKRLSGMTQELEFSKEPAKKASYSIRQQKPLAETDAKSKIRLLKDVDAQVSSRKEVLTRLFSFEDLTTKTFYLNSEGSRIISEIPRFNFSYLIAVSHAGKTSQRFWQVGESGGFDAVECKDLPSHVLSEVKAIRTNLEKGIAAPKGVFDVVVSPEITGIMVHESVGHPYEADRILGREAAQAGESFVTPSMLGSRIGSTAVNVADDPTIANSYGYYLYDDEGVRGRKKLLIKEGIISEFLHNRETAAAFNLSSNGSARASHYDREPIIRMSNTFMVPGEYSEKELIEGVRNGIYMKSFMEWNIDDKRLNQKYRALEAYMIKNGRIGLPVRGACIEISTPSLYSAVDAVGNNLAFHAGNCGKGEPMQGIPAWLGGPSIRLRKIRMSKNG